MFWKWQEKASESLPPECSTGNSQDEGEELEEAHDDNDANSEEEDEFDSSDEEILTKSGW